MKFLIPGLPIWRPYPHACFGGWQPAIDANNDGTCPAPARDQRGVKRLQDDNGDSGPACDINSYEFVFTGGAPVQAPQEPEAQEPVAPDSLSPERVSPAPVSNGGGTETGSNL